MKSLYTSPETFHHRTSRGWKLGAFMVALLLCCSTVFAQAPSNDDCAAAENLMIGTSLNGTTNGASNDNASYCQAQNTSPGVWYEVAGNGQPITVSTCNGANFDTKIGVYKGGCGGLYCIGGNDDSPNCTFFSSEVTFASEVGVSYKVLIHGFGSTTGNFTISAAANSAVASNATCATAAPATCGQVINGTTTGGSISTAPTCDGVSITSPGVWYSFTGSGGPMVLTTCGTNTNFDTRLSIFTGSCGNFTCAGSNDDYCGLQSRVELSSTVSGTTYYALVHAFGTEMGDFDLEITCPVPPSNDQPCGATPLVYGSNPFDNMNALSDPTEVSPGAGSDPNSCRQENGWCFFEPNVQNSVWFEVIAPASGCVSVLVQGFDVQAALWSATDCNDYSTFREIWANDDSGNLLDPSLPASGPSALVEVACLNPGQAYYLQVDGFNGAEGQGTIELSDCNNAPLTLDAPSCISAFTGAGIALDTTHILATASGGFPPYSWEWPSYGVDSTMLYPNDIGSGIAVCTKQTSIYTVILTDSKGCTQTADITVNIENVNCLPAPTCGGGGRRDTNVAVCFTPDPAQYPVTIDFDTDAAGNAIPAGARITDQYAAYGLNISAYNNRSRYLNQAITFPSHAPTGRDYDLGTPNQHFNGPGIGSGGQNPNALNDQALNNTLIIAENLYDNNNDGLVDDPDDEAYGGVLSFNFDSPVTIHTVKLVDLNVNYGNPVMICYLYGGGRQYIPIPYYGRNSVKDFNIDVANVIRFRVVYVCTGAVAELSFTPDTTQLCLNPAEYNIDSMVATPSYGFGTCGSSCEQEADEWDVPVPCEDLTLTVTGDIFSDFENSWSLVDLNTSVVIDSRDPGQVVGLATETNVYCVDPTHCYEFTMFDQFGDGFFYGGSYQLDFLGTNINSVFLDPLSAPLFSEANSVGTCGSRLANPEQLDIKAKAYPNPFSEATTISFSFPEASDAKVEVINMQGMKVAELFNGTVDANQTYEVIFESGDNGSGLYFYRITNSKGHIQIGKLIVQK